MIHEDNKSITHSGLFREIIYVKIEIKKKFYTKKKN